MPEIFGEPPIPPLTLRSASGGSIPLTITAAPGQSGRLLQILDSDASTLVRFSPSGALFIADKQETTGHRVQASMTLINPPAGGLAVAQIQGTAKGTATVVDRLHGVTSRVLDASDVVNKTISGATNNGSGLIRITATAHGFSTGDKIAVYGVAGTTEANGAWTITVIDANTFDLQGSTFTNAYTSGGTATNRPMLYAFFAVVVPRLARGGLTGTADHGDDVNAFTAYNAGTSIAADAVYIARNTGIAGNEWATLFSSPANAAKGIVLSGAFTDTQIELGGSAGTGLKLGGTSYTWGIDFNSGTFTGGQAIRLKHATAIFSRNVAGSGGVEMLKLNSFDQVQVSATLAVSGSIVMTDARNVQVGTGTGTKLGTAATQKLGFWNATPVVQPAAVTDADGTLASATSQLNALLSRLRSVGLIAT